MKEKEEMSEIFKYWIPVVKKDKKGMTAYQRAVQRQQKKRRNNSEEIDVQKVLA